MMRNRPKLHANLMVVKGVQWEVSATMEATSLLMDYMCGPIAVSIIYHYLPSLLHGAPTLHGIYYQHSEPLVQW